MSSGEASSSQPSIVSKAKEYVELHDQVENSLGLLDSLEGFLATFQTDLTNVSGQISNLQERSKEIDGRLKARKKIQKPLSSLLNDLAISPTLAETILDTDVGEQWLTVIPDLEHRLSTLNARKRVKAARDLAEVAEGLRIVAATKMRSFFFAVIQPIKASMNTNMQVLQTSVLIKYRSLYEFLQNFAEDVAKEIQRTYVIAARVYYETGFRRYTRSLGWIKSRVPAKADLIAAVDSTASFAADDAQLQCSKIDGPAVVPAYLGEDKAYKEPIESLLRSMLLVLMDNATAEYTFLASFFAPPPKVAPVFEPQSAALFPAEDREMRRVSANTDDVNTPLPGHERFSTGSSEARDRNDALSKEEEAALASTWKQILEPTLAYCQTFATSVLEPSPPITSLLIMIRIIENVLAEVQTRGCAPLEGWLFGLRMQFWPVFQKMMSEHISSLSKLNESSAGGYFRRGNVVTDANVKTIIARYCSIFSSFVSLTETEEETVVFNNLLKLRQEVTALVVGQAKRLNDPLKTANYQSNSYELALQTLSKGQLAMTHPKAQAELAYWREREEESRRRLLSAARPTT
ncbi:hypothetical protein SCHPADRAFT_921851, partial [Schizopora paradoxa]